MTFLVVIVIFYMFYAQSRRELSTQNMRTCSRQVDMQVEYYEKMEHHNADLRKFWHDYKNLLTGLRALLEADDVPQALQYIEDMGDIIISDQFYFNTGNYIADALLSTKNMIAVKKSTSISFDGYIPSDQISSFDLCVV